MQGKDLGYERNDMHGASPFVLVAWNVVGLAFVSDAHGGGATRGTWEEAFD